MRGVKLIVCSAVMSKENIQNLSSYDATSIVKNDGIIKEQVHTEIKVSKEWKDKWGFLLTFDKLCIEEAAKKGVSEEKYRKLAEKFYKKKPKKHMSFWKQLPTVPIPETCAGYIGWRSRDPECCLELFGPLYTSPKQTLPYEIPMYSILLR